MIVIKDLISLTDFMETVAGTLPDLAQFLPLSNGHRAIDEIAAYFTNDYAGITAFFQVAESRHTDNGAGLDSLTFLCSLTVAVKPDEPGARAGLLARDLSQKLLLQFMGQLKKAVEASQEALEDEGSAYEFTVATSERLFPIGELANADVQGYYIDLDVTIPANHLLYSA